MKPTIEHARRVAQLVRQGLTSGLGTAEPGKMCVEAVVCMALGLPHGDNPPCVGSAVREFKIALNDGPWSSKDARARGLIKLAVAQLGSAGIDQEEFSRIVSRETIRRIIPIALRTAAKVVPTDADELERAAQECERNPTVESAGNAAADADAADAESASAAASFAADAAADADAAAAADAAASFAATAATSLADEILSRSAEIALEALIQLRSPGCEWLEVCQ